MKKGYDRDSTSFKTCTTSITSCNTVKKYMQIYIVSVIGGDSESEYGFEITVSY